MTTQALTMLADHGPDVVDDVRRAVFRRLGLILFVALCTVIFTYIGFQFTTDQFQSTARVLVKLGRENVELPVTVDKGSMLSTGVRKEEVNSEIQLIGSRELLEAVVDALGVEAFTQSTPPPQTLFQRLKADVKRYVKGLRQWYKDMLIMLSLRPKLTEREEITLLLQSAITIERERDSDVIAIAAKLPSGELAMKVVDTLTRLYLNKRLDVRRERGMSSFFDDQLQALRIQLNVLDADKQRLRDSRSITSVGEERSLLLGRLQILYGEIANDDRELKLLLPSTGAPAINRGTRGTNFPPFAETLSSQATATPQSDIPVLTSFPNVEQLRSKVTELRLRRTELLQRFNESSEAIQRVDREIAQIEETFRAALSLQRSARRAVATALENRLRMLASGEMALDIIERDRAIFSQHYQTYAKRREDARVSEQLDLLRVSNIAVLSPADRPIEPVSPRKLLIFGLSLPFGILLGLTLALALEYFNGTIRDEFDLPSADRALVLGRL